MFIYKITNKINGKTYVGQTNSTISKRWREHCQCQSHCSILSRAIAKYGESNFIIEEIDGANSQTELNYKEWLYVFKNNSLVPSGYNLREGGGSKGRHSVQTKNKLSIIAKTSEKHINAIKRKQIPIVRSDGVVYDSVNNAAREMGVSQGNISSVLRGNRKTTGGFSFTYLR